MIDGERWSPLPTSADLPQWVHSVGFDPGRKQLLAVATAEPDVVRTWLWTAGAWQLVTLLLGGAVWAGTQLADQLWAPGVPGATGSGPCGSTDSVNIQLVYSGQSIHACTRDRPICSNQDPSLFTLDNQLRSSLRRYILFIQFDGTFPADMSAQTIQLDPSAMLPKGPRESPPADRSGPPHAIIQVTPRDPTEGGFTPSSGAIVLSSTHGIFTGAIDAAFPTGSRPDRPQPSPSDSPVRMSGAFMCAGR